MRESHLRSSALARIVMVVILGLLLLIPAEMMGQLVAERKTRRDKAVDEMAEKWGGAQTLIGPVLSIPLRRPSATSGKPAAEFIHILPARLTADAVISPEVRWRGIYRAVLYSAKLRLQADFPAPLPAVAGVASSDLQWADAFVSVGLSDLRGLRSLSVTRAGAEAEIEPGLRTQDLLKSGVTIPTPLSPGGAAAPMTIEVELKGSEALMVAPLGKETLLRAGGPWQSPSFAGAFLPETRAIDGEGFSAEWSVLQFNRNLPQAWLGARSDLEASTFGVQLLLPVDEYQRNERAVKYAMLFIALTFMVFILIDVLANAPFHPVHYALVGFALLLFFVLLLSLSEHISFNPAYAIASGATILLVAQYARGVTGRWRPTLAIAGALAALYAFLLVVLLSEDYALLLGSLGLFACLALVMYLTRRLDWFALGERPCRPRPAGDGIDIPERDEGASGGIVVPDEA